MAQYFTRTMTLEEEQAWVDRARRGELPRYGGGGKWMAYREINGEINGELVTVSSFDALPRSMLALWDCRESE